MNVEPYRAPSYPLVSFLVRHGVRCAILVGLLPLVAAAALTIAGWSAVVLGVAIVVSVVLTVLLLSYVEVLRIIADTLMPR